MTTVPNDPRPAGTVDSLLPPTVTLTAVFARVGKLVDNHQFPAAAVLLDLITDRSGSPPLSAYRALVDVLEEFDRAGLAGSDLGRSAWQVEAALRLRVHEQLTGQGNPH